MWIRRVLVPGLTDDPAELQQLKDFIDSLSSVEKVEILPYHTLGLFKWQNLGIEYPLEGVPVPTPEQVQQMNTLRGALMDAILAENASREAKNNEGRTEL